MLSLEYEDLKKCAGINDDLAEQISNIPDIDSRSDVKGLEIGFYFMTSEYSFSEEDIIKDSYYKKHIQGNGDLNQEIAECYIGLNSDGMAESLPHFVGLVQLAVEHGDYDEDSEEGLSFDGMCKNLDDDARLENVRTCVLMRKIINGDADIPRGQN